MNAAADLDDAERVDLAFPVLGDSLKRDHRAALASALVRLLPWLGVEPGTGVHRVNVVPGAGAQALLSARTRVVLRIPREQAGAAAAQLAGAMIEFDGDCLQFGTPQLRELLPHRTLYAHFVAATADDEAAFLTDVGAELEGLGVDCRLVCGRRQQVRIGPDVLSGFSLMLDGLDRADALRVMRRGIGPHRGLGCGLFVPHKSAAAVGA